MGFDRQRFFWRVCQSPWDPMFGLGAKPMLEPILVVGLNRSCSLGVLALDFEEPMVLTPAYL